MRVHATHHAATLHRIGLSPAARPRAALAKLTRFAVVGGSGVLVNNLALLFLHEVTKLPLVAATALAVELAIISNFFWNDRWTFAQRSFSLRRFGRFNLVSLGGLAIATTMVWLLSERFGLYYLLANLVGIGLSTIWNFAVNYVWTWGWSS